MTTLTISDIDQAAVDAVIFDMDGTIYNKQGLPARLVAGEIGRLFLFSRERKARSEMKGVDYGSEDAFYAHFFEVMGGRCRLTKWLVKWWYFHDYLPLMVRVLKHEYKIEPWVVTLFEELRKAGKKIVIYSDYECVEQKLQALGADPSMADVIVSAAELGGLKPSGASMQRLVERIGVPVERCLMVGDRDNTDGESARAVGMQFYLVNNKRK